LEDTEATLILAVPATAVTVVKTVRAFKNGFAPLVLTLGKVEGCIDILQMLNEVMNTMIMRFLTN
jgi:hypothetical protein